MLFSSESGSSPFLVVPFNKRLTDRLHHCTITFKNHSEIILLWRSCNSEKTLLNTSGPVSSSGPVTSRKRCWSMSGEGEWSWWSVQKIRYEDAVTGSWGCLALRNLREDLISLYSSFKGDYSQVRVNLFSQATRDRMRGSGLKLQLEMSRLDMWKYFFTQKVVSHWNGLPRVVQSPSWEVFKTQVDVALNAVACLPRWCSAKGWTPWPWRSFPTSTIL